MDHEFVTVARGRGRARRQAMATVCRVISTFVAGLRGKLGSTQLKPCGSSDVETAVRFAWARKLRGSLFSHRSQPGPALAASVPALGGRRGGVYPVYPLPQAGDFGGLQGGDEPRPYGTVRTAAETPTPNYPTSCSYHYLTRPKTSKEREINRLKSPENPHVTAHPPPRRNAQWRFSGEGQATTKNRA